MQIFPDKTFPMSDKSLPTIWKQLQAAIHVKSRRESRLGSAEQPRDGEGGDGRRLSITQTDSTINNMVSTTGLVCEKGALQRQLRHDAFEVGVLLLRGSLTVQQVARSMTPAKVLYVWLAVMASLYECYNNESIQADEDSAMEDAALSLNFEARGKSPKKGGKHGSGKHLA
eukprot:CAMPEP_0197845382 /NCGR_PEP_ID=MMETSP1438-20131217/2323_1 /TAXON_ID=1461541 /ORGANISM="Pterosperma sp., Strain CCMP1384" /LENGTH=170 /DNA_ID=CAMNT_0043456659 /DNA_START=117 /DNA_END=629 /DNA_ORIENTATION=+